MPHSAFFWLIVTLICLIVQGLYSMLEMASVSFNRVRLEYYITKGFKRAVWLQYLLKKPSRLFGTVMIGVNVALQVGSQAAREFYLSLGLDPDIAMITQVFIVVIVAELAPLFAAHKYAEHVVMLGVPLLYITNLVLSPIIWFIGILSRLINFIFRTGRESYNPFLSRDELQKILETHEEEFMEGEEFNYVVSNIFALKNKSITQVMIPLTDVLMIPSNATIEQLRKKLSHLTPSPSFVPIYHNMLTQVVGMAIPRDLVKVADHRSVRNYARSPWFITEETPLLQVLKQFRVTNENVAVVLNKNGLALGLLTLESVLEEIFGEWAPSKLEHKPQTHFIERSFSGNTRVSDFNAEYGASLPFDEGETLAQLMISLLERLPEEGESLFIGPFEFIAKETTLLGIKTIDVKTVET